MKDSPNSVVADPAASSFQTPQSGPTAGNKIFFPNLDALRFIAFSLVFLQHGMYGAFKLFEGHSSILNSLIRLFFCNGGTGVQIFFVLSGFLITYLIILEIQREGKLNVGMFYMRRTLRIWPLYFATVLFAFVIYPYLKGLMGIDSQLCSRPAYYFSFLANFDLIRIAKECPGRDAMTQGIVWSVAIEEQFYLVWPLLFLIFRKVQPLIFLLILAVCLSFRISNMYETGPELYYHTFSVMGDLAIGGLGAYLALNSTKFLGFFERLPKSMIRIIYLIMFSMYFFREYIFQNQGGLVLVRWVFDLLWIFVILEQNFSTYSPFKLKRLKFFSRWGKYTYGLYMLHPVGILIVDIAMKMLHVKAQTFTPLLLLGCLSLVLSLLLARASYHWLETPFLKLKERFTVIRTQTT